MTDRYAVTGNPVAHSKSPWIHTEFARQTHQDMAYERIEAPLDGFARTLDEFRAAGGRGTNVTLPFKQEAFAYVTEASDRARDAGAVNTFKFDHAHVQGDNTDGVGLVNDIRKNLGWEIKDRRVLLVGAGGAARGVIGPLLALHPRIVAITNRTFSKAEGIALHFAAAGNVKVIAQADLPGHQFDIIINATAASLENKLPMVPCGAFAESSLAYDMMYGRPITPFLALAQQAGAIVADGLGMLVEQAAEAFLLWHGVRPDTGPVLQQIRHSIAPN